MGFKNELWVVMMQMIEPYIAFEIRYTALIWKAQYLPHTYVWKGRVLGVRDDRNPQVPITLFHFLHSFFWTHWHPISIPAPFLWLLPNINHRFALRGEWLSHDSEPAGSGQWHYTYPSGLNLHLDNWLVSVMSLGYFTQRACETVRRWWHLD